MASEHELQVQQKREVDKKPESTTPGRRYLPVTDIFETQDALKVILEMPGVDKDGIEVRVENDVLTIDGQVDFSKYDGLTPVYTEYNVGNYTRTFQLSNQIDQDRISADLHDGVITLVLPKAEKAKPRTIKIK